jgi:8-amino-3,8-dideoxy-alpha-D-manno-octulosonate transaminase
METTTRLAIEGGRPVRTTPLPPRLVGAGLIGAEEKRLVNEVIDSRSLFRHYGPNQPHFVNDFENEFRELFGVKYALATATGSGGYFCAMRALEIGPGDEVIIPAFGWITDYAMIDNLGGVPVFAAIDESLNISPEDFKAKITPRTKAVVIVYYQGGASRVDELVAIARQHKLKILEDNAQACGGDFAGRKLGSWGDIACFSLQGNKVITSGDGGMVVTNDQRLYELCVRYHDLGQLRETFKQKLESAPLTEPMAGYQWRMNELTGAVALAQLRKLPRIVSACQKNSANLRGRLAAKFDKLVFRATRPENDIGILLAFDLKTPANVEFFRKAYEAEGLPYGPTSWCETLSDIPSVSARLKFNGIAAPETIARTKAIDERYAKLAILPVYTDEHMEDIATGVLKVLAAMHDRAMIDLGKAG